MTLNKQIWIAQILENFYPSDSFLTHVSDFSGFVENDIIHFASAGIDPKVLINNTTYPIKTVQRTDEDYGVKLDLFETENTLVRRPEAVELAYNKLESVLSQHRNTLRKAVSSKAIHAFAPSKEATDTPVIKTTGAIANGRKRMTFEDLLTLKEGFDAAEIPLEERYIVLHPKHVTDLLLEDIKLFKDLTNIKDGEPFRFAGFGCYQFSQMPHYTLDGNQLTKIAYDEKKQGECFASVAFYAKEVMKADGDIHMYSRLDDPEERATIVGFDKRFIAMPIRGKGVGAIVSANV